MVKFPSQHLKSCFSHRIEHIATLDLLLQVHLFFLPLIILHDLEPKKVPFRSTDSNIQDLKPLLLHQSAFLNVELLLSLGIDLLSFFICFLKKKQSSLIIFFQLRCVVKMHVLDKKPWLCVVKAVCFTIFPGSKF